MDTHRNDIPNQSLIPQRYPKFTFFSTFSIEYAWKASQQTSPIAILARLHASDSSGWLAERVPPEMPAGRARETSAFCDTGYRQSTTEIIRQPPLIARRSISSPIFASSAQFAPVVMETRLSGDCQWRERITFGRHPAGPGNFRVFDAGNWNTVDVVESENVGGGRRNSLQMPGFILMGERALFLLNSEPGRLTRLSIWVDVIGECGGERLLDSFELFIRLNENDILSGKFEIWLFVSSRDDRVWDFVFIGDNMLLLSNK